MLFRLTLKLDIAAVRETVGSDAARVDVPLRAGDLGQGIAGEMTDELDRCWGRLGRCLRPRLLEVSQAA